MKRSSVVVVAGCLVALFIGLALAYPMLASDLTASQKVSGTVEVVYAYIGDLNVDANVSGLWRNFSEPAGVVAIDGTCFGYDVHALSYLIVLRITNPATDPIGITSLDVMVGPQISRDNKTGSLTASNNVLVGHQETSFYPGWNNLWSEGASRLVYLSGVVGAHDFTYAALQNESITIYASAEGQVWGDQKASFAGYTLKQVQLQNFAGNYLYNNLVGVNQTLVFYSSLDVSVGLRQQP